MAAMKLMIHSASLKKDANRNADEIEIINLNYKIQYQDQTIEGPK